MLKYGENRPELVHEHFILDAELVEPLNFDNRIQITTSLINDIMNTLGMQKLGKLEVYDATDDLYPGWSFIQPITTSHISGHYFEEKTKPSHIHLDIYSCKFFNWESVISLIHKHLGLSRWTGNYIIRANEAIGRKILLIEGYGESIKRN